MSIPYNHHSVLKEEVVSFFKDKIGGVLVDATAGGGGHLQMLAQIIGDKGKIFAFDQDIRAHQDDAAGGVARNFTNIKLIHAPFSHIKNVLIKENIKSIDGIVCDLGVSSNQLDDNERGFSFLLKGPIDMRMNTSSGITAYEWLEQQSEQEIADALFIYGGERKSRSIARMIKSCWPIENSTEALAQLVCKAMRQKKWSKTHPATRTFQAIRIAVNKEMDELKSLLADMPDLLHIGGVAVFISFHSLEDRLIKQCFKSLDDRFVVLTKKPLVASTKELDENRRSRSAKLRALRRVS